MVHSLTLDFDLAGYLRGCIQTRQRHNSGSSNFVGCTLAVPGFDGANPAPKRAGAA